MTRRYEYGSDEVRMELVFYSALEWPGTALGRRYRSTFKSVLREYYEYTNDFRTRWSIVKV